jgi:hypothetical protein
MTMRSFKYAPLAVMLAIVPQVNADSLMGDVAPYAYMNVPFGGTTKSQDEMKYGLAMGQGGKSGSLNLSGQNHPPLLNLEFKGEELNAVHLNGTNVLEKHIRYNANGVAQTENEINWWLVGGAVLLAGLCIGDVICDTGRDHHTAAASA